MNVHAIVPNADVPPTDATSSAPDPRSELALVRRVLERVPEALAAFDHYLAKIPAIVTVHRNARRSFVLEQEVPDLVQDCLAVVWRKLPEFEGRAALSTWMFRVCSLELRNGFRRVEKGRRTGGAGDGGAGEIATTRDDPAARLNELDVEASLAQLDPLQEQVIRMRHYEEQTFDEIAAQLGLKTSQAKTRYYRALQRMHDWFAARGTSGSGSDGA